MHNPLRGVITSEHEDDGGYNNHWGRDTGPRDAQGRRIKGAPVYAPFSGWWVKIVRWSFPGNRSWTWAAYATGNGGLVRNPDGEAQGFNHVMVRSRWREGVWINEGDLIGYLDDSGNQSAQHLHLETWSDWRNRYSHFSPKILFDKYKVKASTNPAPVLKPAAPKPTPPTAVKPEPVKEWSDMASKEDFKAALREVLAEPASKELFRDAVIEVLQEEQLVPWRDSVTQEIKHFTYTQAMGFISVHWARELERDGRMVSWVDSVTKEKREIPIEKALEMISIHWGRELERDLEKDLAAGGPNNPAEGVENTDDPIDIDDEDLPVTNDNKE